MLIIVAVILAIAFVWALISFFGNGASANAAGYGSPRDRQRAPHPRRVRARRNLTIDVSNSSLPGRCCAPETEGVIDRGDVAAGPLAVCRARVDGQILFGFATLIVGGARRFCTARIVKIASSTGPPRRWPVIDFVAETTACSPMTRFTAAASTPSPAGWRSRAR